MIPYKTKQKVSLRGSLAAEYLRLHNFFSQKLADEFMESILFKADPAIEKATQEGMIIVGRISEKGKYFPDW